MDQDSLRALSTLLVFLAFIGITISVYWRGRKSYFDQAASLPFADEDVDNKQRENRDE